MTSNAPQHTIRDRLYLLRVFAAARILAFPSRLKKLWSMDFMRDFFQRPKRDRLYFFAHDYYLSRYFTLAQRADCAIAHYEFERANATDTYRNIVYGSLPGLELWRCVADDGVRYTIMLCATDDNRYEGDLSVWCWAGHSRVCLMSFSYVPAAVFGGKPGVALFVTRNQTDRNPELALFRRAFKQNSPPYFCFAAICGIAMANGFKEIYAIRSEAQISYEERYAEGFRNSYSGLWHAFGATDAGRHAQCIPLPLELTSLAAVKHRNRAMTRRRHWYEIMESARKVQLEYRRSAEPAPLDLDASLLQGIDRDSPKAHTDSV